MRLFATVTQALAAVPRALTLLALAAAALALLAPSAAVSEHSDLLLGALVLATALGIPAGALLGLRAQLPAIAFLSVVPTIVLTALAWLIGRAFGPDVRDGLLAVGLSSVEIAAVGLAALAGADAAIALGVVTGSLIIAALAGPAAIGWLAGSQAHAEAGQLLGRFALVLIAPLAAGVAIRTLAPRVATRDREREGVAAVTVAALVYAALSGTAGAHLLGGAFAAALALLLVSGLLAELWRRRTPAPVALAGALTIGMRDFAGAAALAAQAFGPRAAAVPGVYGVLMLLGGTIAAARSGAGRSGAARSEQ